MASLKPMPCTTPLIKGADRDHGVIRELVHGIGNFSPDGGSMR
jgi:hypothetical protein